MENENGMEQVVFSVTLVFLDGISSNAAGRSVIIGSNLTQTAIPPPPICNPEFETLLLDW